MAATTAISPLPLRRPSTSTAFRRPLSAQASSSSIWPGQSSRPRCSRANRTSPLTSRPRWLPRRTAEVHQAAGTIGTLAKCGPHPRPEAVFHGSRLALPALDHTQLALGLGLRALAGPSGVDRGGRRSSWLSCCHLSLLNNLLEVVQGWR